MKKEYVKPVMDIVSFTTENIITASGLTVKSNDTGSYQTKFTTIYY